MHLVSFDPTEMKGKIIANTTRVNRDALDEILAVFYDTINSGRAVSPMIRVTEGKRLAKIKTACCLQPDPLRRSAQAWHTGSSQGGRPGGKGGKGAYQVHRYAHVLG